MLQDTLRSLATGASWSGHERNHLFFGGRPGNQFENLSGVSGLDDPGDSRGFAILDFDRDGWLDIALVNLGAPQMRLLHNDIGDRPAGRLNRFIAVRFVGGNHRPEPSTEWSARDGYGTSVEIDLGDGLTLTREHQPEQGFKTQNSSTMLVGIGRHDAATTVTVRWLSGKLQTASDIPAGTLLTVHEDPSTSPTGEAFVLESYVKKEDGEAIPPARVGDAWRARVLPETPSSGRLVINGGGSAGRPQSGGLNFYTTMATWCVACITEMPELIALRDAFTEEELAMFGIPIDPKDSADKLQRWVTDREPPYRVLIGLPESEISGINALVESELRFNSVPAAFVTDSAGRVLLARWGVPSVSAVRKLLWTNGGADRARVDTGG